MEDGYKYNPGCTCERCADETENLKGSRMFKVGDKVKCLDTSVDNCGRLTKDQEYVVSRAVDGGLYITDNLYPNSFWFSHRFELVESSCNDCGQPQDSLHLKGCITRVDEGCTTNTLDSEYGWAAVDLGATKPTFPLRALARWPTDHSTPAILLNELGEIK